MKMTKTALIEEIASETGLSKRQVRDVLGSLAKQGYASLKQNGEFLVPGFAKFVVKNKPAVPERQGINPFTKEPTTFKAKPARKVLKARPVKAIKDAIN